MKMSNRLDDLSLTEHFWEEEKAISRSSKANLLNIRSECLRRNRLIYFVYRSVVSLLNRQMGIRMRNFLDWKIDMENLWKTDSDVPLKPIRREIK